MKKSRIFLLLLGAIVSAGCSVTSSSRNYPPQDLLYGAWHCNDSFEEDEVEVVMDFEVNYVRNGLSNAYGTMILSSPDISDLEYSIASSGSWEYKDGYLIETTTEMKVVKVSHSEVDFPFGLEDFVPQKISDSLEVMVLNGNTLTVKSESDGLIYSCKKARR